MTIQKIGNEIGTSGTRQRPVSVSSVPRPWLLSRGSGVRASLDPPLKNPTNTNSLREIARIRGPDPWEKDGVSFAQICGISGHSYAQIRNRFVTNLVAPEGAGLTSHPDARRPIRQASAQGVPTNPEDPVSRPPEIPDRLCSRCKRPARPTRIVCEWCGAELARAPP